jgi:hypothetical protein
LEIQVFFIKATILSTHNGYPLLPTIEKLEGRKNYSTWKTQMRYYLSREELWDLTSIRPDTAAIKDYVYTVTASLCFVVREGYLKLCMVSGRCVWNLEFGEKGKGFLFPLKFLVLCILVWTILELQQLAS